VSYDATYAHVTLELLGSTFPVATGAPVLVGLFKPLNLFFMLRDVLANVISVG
jgi:hypothetical protein